MNFLFQKIQKSLSQQLQLRWLTQVLQNFHSINNSNLSSFFNIEIIFFFNLNLWNISRLLWFSMDDSIEELDWFKQLNSYFIHFTPNQSWWYFWIWWISYRLKFFSDQNSVSLRVICLALVPWLQTYAYESRLARKF